MGISVKWLVEPKIILLENWGKISPSDIKEELSQFVKFFNEAPGKTHIIADARRIEEISLLNPLAMPEMMQFLKHPNRGWVIFVGSNQRLVNFWVAMLSKAGLPYKFMSTIEEATEFLIAMDKIDDQRKE